MRNRLFSVVLWVVAIVCLASNVACQSSQNEAGEILNEVQRNVRHEMKLLDQDLAAAAKELSGLDLAGSRAHTVLTELLQDRPYLVDAGTMGRSANIAAIEPAAYYAYEGSDISGQEHIIRSFLTLKPVLSENFQAVEGFEAAVMHHPVFSPSNEIAGAVWALFKPEILLESIISPAVRNTSFTVWVTQTNGRVIYDEDAVEIGKNLFIDPLYQPYPKLVALCREIVDEATGTGQYEFLDTGLNQTVKKEAIWSTFALHGTEWRLVLIQVVP